LEKARELLEDASAGGWLTAAELLHMDKLPEGPAALNFWTPYLVTDAQGNIVKTNLNRAFGDIIV